MRGSAEGKACTSKRGRGCSSALGDSPEPRAARAVRVRAERDKGLAEAAKDVRALKAEQQAWAKEKKAYEAQVGAGGVGASPVRSRGCGNGRTRRR